MPADPDAQRYFDLMGIPILEGRAFDLRDTPEQPRVVVVNRAFAERYFAGQGVLVVPSTYVQARLNFAMQELELSADPAGFAVHAVVDGELVSHIHPVR